MATYLQGVRPRTVVAELFELDAPGLDPFEPIFAAVLKTAFTSGIRAVEAAGHKPQDIPARGRAAKRFVKGVHYGYDSAQFKIGTIVTQLEQRVRTLEAEVREERTRGLADDPRRDQLMAAIKNRQLVLRRVADAILHTMINHQSWILRRVIIDDTIRRIDPGILSVTLRAASALNSATRHRFHLVSDLTTVVQVGDIVEVEITAAGGRWRFIELKSGRMNALLEGILEQGVGASENVDRVNIDKQLGEHAAAQAVRIVRQKKRMAAVNEIIATDRGVDLHSGRQMRLVPGLVETDDYVETLDTVLGTVEGGEVALATVDGCLDLVGCSGEYLRENGLGAVQHQFHHCVIPTTGCSLGRPGSESLERKELESITNFVDLVQVSMVSRWGRPVVLWGFGFERTRALIMGRARVFARLRMDQLFRVGADIGLTMDWIVGSDSERLKKLSSPIAASQGASGVRARAGDGEELHFMSGFFDRAIADLARPRQLLVLMKRACERPRGPAEA